MKKNILLIIFGMFLMYIIIIAYGLVLTLINKGDIVTLDNNIVYENIMKNNSDRIKEFKTIEPDLNVQSCLNELEILVNKSLETYEFGEINMTKLIKDNFTISSEGILTYYTNIIRVCNLSDEDKNIISTYVLNSQYYYETLINKYRFDYEVNFKSVIFREIAESDIDVLGYKYAKISESLAIDYILDKMEAKYE